MKKLMTLISLLAIVNMAGVLGLAGWLVASGRLDKDRATQLRAMLSETVEQQRAREEREAAALETAEEALPTAESIEQGLEAAREAGDVELLRRLRDEQDAIHRLESLRREQGVLDEARATFETERDGFLAMRDRLTQIEGDEQFKKSLGVLEGLKAPDATANLLSLLSDNKREEVVSYLDAMDDRKRVKIFAELTKSAPDGLAAQLLEDLRTRGLIARGSEDPSP